MSLKRSTEETREDEAKRLKSESGVGVSPGALTQDKIQAMLEATKRNIAMRKQALKMDQPPEVPMQAQGNSQVNVQALQASVQSRLAALRAQQVMRSMPPGTSIIAPGTVTATGLPHSLLQQQLQQMQFYRDRPQALVLDPQGRLIDAAGQEVKMVTRAPEFKANLRVEKQESSKTEAAEAATLEEASYYDPRLTKASGRERRQFRFHEPGKFLDLAERKRAQEHLERLQAEIAIIAKKTGISSATKLALIAPKKGAEDHSVPDIEWWDQSIIAKETYNTLDAELPREEKFRDITHLIQHPILIQPPAEPAKPPTIPIMLTKKERKKMRTQRRKAEEKERQEKIRLGLMEAPAPKVKKSSFMRTLANEAIQEPSKVEAIVNAQVAMRQRKHMEDNAARQLTPAEKKEKLLKKLKEDTLLEVSVAVYRINSLRDDAVKYKVETNAKQMYLTGVAVMHHDVNVIIVEGGAKGMKQYRKLMMHRIKWEGKGILEENDDEEEEEKKVNRCVLVWEGAAKKRAFSIFEMKACRTEQFARDLLEKHGVPHYWDLALSDAVVEQAES